MTAFYTEEHPLHGGYTGDRADLLDFSANINPLGMPPAVRRAVTDTAADWERYPDPVGRRLCGKLAEKTGIPAERIVVGNGADDLIFRMVRAVSPKRAYLTAPAFSEYEAALRQNGCAVEFHILDSSDLFDINRDFMSSITDDVDVVFLCNPNNPTGRLTEEALLYEILSECTRHHAMLVCDECFLPFAADGARRSLLQVIREEKRDAQNLIVLRAFTKLYAMPGLRLGYCVCGSTQTARQIRGSGPYWSVSAPALSAGEAALGEKDYVNQTVEYISCERAFLEDGLRSLHLKFIPSAANFILLYCSLPLYELLLEEGIVIRDCSDFRGLEKGWYRIAVRTHAENERLLAALKGLLWHIPS